MAMQQLLLPGEIVKKHNNLIRSKINISNKTSSRILACLVAAIRNEDKQFKESYTVPVKDYLPPDENDGKGGRQYKLAREACRELVKASIEREWPDPDEPNGDPIFQIMPFFTSITCRKGIVKANFNPKLSDLLLQLKSFFTEYNLIEYLRLPSTYSQRLFEILKSWSNIKTGEVIMPVSKLHHMLNTPSSFRKDFREFRRWVLEKAHKDILVNTTLQFEWEPIKVGRSVESIRFTFGPSHRAIAEAEKAKAKEEKQNRLMGARILRANECAMKKNCECATMDNKPIVCKVCRQFQICDDIRRRGGKPYNPYNTN